MRIVILEDNAERQEFMRAAIADRFSSFVVEFFAAAQSMIARLEETGLYDVALISLDHDLELVPDGRGGCVDPGTGGDVATWLAEQPAVAPVIVHTTNTVQGDRMSELLAAAGWRLSRIVPYDGTTWITSTWRALARDLIVGLLPAVNMSSLGAEIIRCALRSNRPYEWTVRELLRSAASVFSNDADRTPFCLEFLYVSSTNHLREIAGIGLPVLREFVGATPLAIIEESVEAIGRGPISPTSEFLEPMFAERIQSLNVEEVQLEVVQPRPDMQAILFAASLDKKAPLSSHWVQAGLRELKVLLEISLVWEIHAGTSVQPASESLLTSRPHRN